MKTKLLSLFCSLFILINCASVESVKKGKSSGISVVYKTSLENAWVYTKKIFNENGFEIKEENKNKSIFGRSESHTIDNGRIIGVWITPINEKEVAVTAYSKQVLATKIANWFDHKDFHEKFRIYVDTE